MLGKMMDLLLKNDIDTYFIGQHKGKCSAPYTVLKDFGDTEISGLSLNQNIIDVLIFYPFGRYDDMDLYITKIKDILKDIAELKDARYTSETLTDDELKAYFTTIRYKRYKAFIR